MSPRYYIAWSESKNTIIEAESESAARQAWIDGLEGETVFEDKIEVYEANVIEVYEVDEKGEKL